MNTTKNMISSSIESIDNGYILKMTVEDWYSGWKYHRTLWCNSLVPLATLVSKLSSKNYAGQSMESMIQDYYQFAAESGVMVTK